MPISNPLTTANSQATPPTISTADPNTPPAQVGLFWLNTTTRQLYLSTGTAAVGNWVAIAQQTDITALLSRIVVANGQVITDGENVIYQ